MAVGDSGRKICNRCGIEKAAHEFYSSSIQCERCRRLTERKRTANKVIRTPAPMRFTIRKGVRFNYKHQKYEAYVNWEGVKNHLGFFDNDMDAAKEYDKAAKDLWGNKARLNFPEERNAS